MSPLYWMARYFPKRQTFYYARINSAAICTSVWRLDEPLHRPDAIAVDSLDNYLIGKQWDGTKWLPAGVRAPALTPAAAPAQAESSLYLRKAS